METALPLKKYDSIELLRFFAAMAVVFVHIPIVGTGHFGVDIFFVISGFVMMLSTEKNTEHFFLKRLIRIVPSYYMFTIGVFIVAFFIPALLNSTTADIPQLIKSLLFVPFDKNGEGHYPVLFLGWTLNYEMYFYALFALSLKISQRHRAFIATIFLTAIFIICHNKQSLPLSAYGNLIVFEFVLGMVIYLMFTRQHVSAVLLFSLVLLVSLLYSLDNLGDRFFRWGLPSAVFVGLFIRLLDEVKLPGIVITLGGASYALYLSHPYVIQIFDKMTDWFNAGKLHQLMALIVSLVLVNVVAVVFYRYIEVPLRGFLRSRLL